MPERVSRRLFFLLIGAIRQDALMRKMCRKGTAMVQLAFDAKIPLMSAKRMFHNGESQSRAPCIA
jgi:hypothetical protein